MARIDLPAPDMAPPSRTTVVVPTRGRPAGAVATVRRLLSLPERPPVIVVADGCGEGTAGAIRRRFPDVEVIEWDTSLGAAPARNAGVAAATTPYVAFCDDDSWWAPGALTSIEEAFDAHPGLGLVAGRILVGETEHLDPVCVDMAGGPPADELPGPAILGFVACAAAARRDALLEVGGFPADYGIGGEEEPLALALAAAGWDLVYLEEALAHHHPSHSGRDDGGRDRTVVRNDLWTAWRWRRPGGALRRTFSLVAGADSPSRRRGVRDAMSALPRVLADRRPVPVEVEAQRRMLEGNASAVRARQDPNAAVARIVRSYHRTRPPATLGLVLVTHNRNGELLENLARLEALPERPHIVVVDNGSNDGTAEAVERHHPGVDLIVLDSNAGAIGRNLATERLSTPYVAFADDDTWWEPGSLQHACKVLDEHPSIAVVTARIVVEPSGREDPVVADMAHSPLPDTDGLPGHPLVSFLAGASVVRRHAFLRVGGFHPRIRFGGEEELLSMDLMGAGWRLRYLPEMTVHHAASRSRDPHRRRAEGLRNALWSAWLRRPLPRALRRSLLLLRRSAPDSISARALAEALAGLPWVVRERRPLPPGVEAQVRLIEDVQLRSPARRYVS